MSGTRTTKKRNTSEGARKTSSAKNKSTKKTTSSGSKKPIVEKGNGIGDEVRLVALLLAAVFLFISNLGKGGMVGAAVSKVMFGILGLFAYAFPVVMLLLILFSLANPGNLIARIKIVGAILGSIAVSALIHALTMRQAGVSKVGEIYQYCAEHHTGGGVIGGGILSLLQNAFGDIGAYLVLAGVLIICIVIVTEKSFVKGMSRGSQKVYDSAVQDMERRKERAEERQERKREQRLEKRVSGVTTDVTIQKQPDAGLVELEEAAPEPEKPQAQPELARIPEEKELEKAFAFPVRESSAHKMPTGGVQEISFSEEDLLKNALTRRELEAEKAASSAKSVKMTSESDYRVELDIEPEEKTILQEEKEPDGEIPSEAVPEIPPQAAIPEYQFPPLSLLKKPAAKKGSGNASSQLQETARLLQEVLQDFGVNATVTDVSQGPAVTRFEVQPAHGVKVNKIVGLADDIKLNLAVPDVRIEAPIPGKAAVGIEVPNKENSVVMLRELLDSDEFKNSKSKISFAVGKDIGGNIMVSDIAKMPHVLIAGATGSGKSVCINTLIMSILYKARPDEVKLIMIDPKVVELSAYNGIPHLLIPVVTDPKKASGALNWAVQEMMGRYNRFAETNVRNIEGYNSKVDALAELEGEKPEKMPQIVIIVDELADLMMVSPGEVEDAICRLAQLARAAGIHLVIATQRPSVNVITGLIKANMPSRIAFAVTSGVDSRTILDMNGAEKLLGKGDMLFSPSGAPKPLRVQGAFVSDAEVGAVVEFLSSQKEQYLSEGGKAVEEQMKQLQTAVENVSAAASAGGSGNDRDVLFAEAGKFIIEKDKASIGMLQRWFKIGFNRAARIMDQLAEAGVVGEEEGTKPRKVLMSMEEFESYIDEYV